MSLGLGRLLLVSTGTAIVGLGAYAIYKSGGVKPAAVETMKAGIKAKNWVGTKYSCAKDGLTELVSKAKTEIDAEIPAAKSA